MITSQGQVIMLLVVLGAGFIIGAALAWWLASRGNTPPVDQDQEVLKEIRKTYAEKATLWQDRSTGQLAVHTGGTLLTSARQMTEAQKRSMNALLKDWAGWMSFTGSQTDAPVIAVETHAQRVLVTPPSEQAEPMPSANLEDGAEAKATNKAAPEKPKSIVEQINDILQDHLTNHPALNKGIRLAEDPREGVIVWVGLEHYLGVDAVADPEVKAVLKEAVKEWERRTQPGKK